MQENRKLITRRACNTQKLALLQYMESRKDFALDGCTASQGFKSNEQEWDFLANHLNTVGFAKKTGSQWKRTWIDMKYGMKKRYIKLAKLKGRSQRRHISAMDDRVRAIILEQGHSDWLSDDDNLTLPYEIDKRSLLADDEVSFGCNNRLPETPNQPEPPKDNNTQPAASTSGMSEKSEPQAPTTSFCVNSNEPLRMSDLPKDQEYGDLFDSPDLFGRAKRKMGDFEKLEKALLKIEKRRYRLKKNFCRKICKIKKHHSIQMLKLKRQEVELLRDIKSAIIR